MQSIHFPAQFHGCIQNWYSKILETLSTVFNLLNNEDRVYLLFTKHPVCPKFVSLHSLDSCCVRVCTHFILDKSVSLWMHNGPHWQSTARGSFYPCVLNSTVSALNRINTKACSPFKKVLAMPAAHQYGNGVTTTLKSILLLLMQQGQPSMFCKYKWTPC